MQNTRVSTVGGHMPLSGKTDISSRTTALLGLPFDNIKFETVISAIDSSADSRTPLFISTPNVNWLIQAQHNKAFRQSISSSDLSLCDGTPIYVLLKLLGSPISRVPGSDLFEKLCFRPCPNRGQLKVFFFGGEGSVAKQAEKNVNSRSKAMYCVGSLNPGFGSVEELSSEDNIKKINDSGADFLIVSLGAVKGQEWIMRNRFRLKVPVYCHLGAVVNFAAGSIARAPESWKKMGLEWVWRIVQEPNLWKRYTTDGLSLTKITFSKITRQIYHRLLAKLKNDTLDFTIEDNSEMLKVHIFGNSALEVTDSLRESFHMLMASTKPVQIDLEGLDFLNLELASLLIRLLGINGERNTVSSTSARTIALLKHHHIPVITKTASVDSI